MGAATTLAGVIAAAVGGVALYRFLERRRRDVDAFVKGAPGRGDNTCGAPIIDYERDPESGVFHPKA